MVPGSGTWRLLPRFLPTTKRKDGVPALRSSLADEAITPETPRRGGARQMAFLAATADVDSWSGHQPGRNTEPMKSEPAQIRSKIRGVSSYQPQTAWCRPGTVLRVQREPTNRHDPNSIRLEVLGGLLFKRWRTLGHISADLAGRFAPLMDRGLVLMVAVLEVTGTKRTTRGVNILIQYDDEHRRAILDEIAQEQLAAVRAEEHKRQQVIDRKTARKAARRKLISDAVASIRRVGGRARAALREAGQQQLGRDAERRGE